MNLEEQITEVKERCTRLATKQAEVAGMLCGRIDGGSQLYNDLMAKYQELSILYQEALEELGQLLLQR